MLGADQMVEFRVNGEFEAAVLSSLPGVSGCRTRGLDYMLSVSDTGAALHALLAEIERQHAKLEALTTHQATLEDVFVSLTGRTLRDE